jgi:hypothetical protein
MEPEGFPEGVAAGVPVAAVCDGDDGKLGEGRGGKGDGPPCAGGLMVMEPKGFPYTGGAVSGCESLVGCTGGRVMAV